MIRGEVIGRDEVVAEIRAMRRDVADPVARAIERLTFKLARRVVSTKLSGQVLKRQTGTLARSVAQSPRVLVTEDMALGTVGTNLAYGRAHEWGWSGTETVRAHMRRSVRGRLHEVRTHTRRMVIPERSFLRTALAEMRPDIVAEVTRAMQ